MSEKQNMADSEMGEVPKVNVTKLRAIFEPATQEQQRVQRRFTRNGPNTALGDFCESPAPKRGTLEKPPKDDAEQVKITSKTGEKDSLVEKESVPDRNMTLGSVQTPSAESGHAFTRLCDEKEHERTGAKPKTLLQTASKQRHDDLDSEKSQLLHENEALDEQLLVLRKREKQGPSKEQCVALEWEIAELKRRKGTTREEITRVESKLEEQAVIKQRLLKLEGVRDGLHKENEADEDTLTQLKERLEPDTFTQMCLEKADDIKKEIVAFTCQKDAFQQEIKLAKSKQAEQDVCKVRCAQFEAEKRVIFCKNKALQDVLAEINRKQKQEPQWSVEYSSELQIEIVGLKMETGALQNEVTQAESTLEEQVAMKEQVLEMEGVRNGLREKKEADEDTLTQLKEKLEPDNFTEMCLEKANDIKKEIPALKSQNDALQKEIELAKSKQAEQDACKVHCAPFEAEKRVIICKNKALQDELAEINRKQKLEQQWTVEYLSELQIEIEGLKMETGALQKEVAAQAESTLEEQAAMKQRILEMEGVRNGLREKKEAAQNELTHLRDKQEPEICMELCLERVNNIEKENLALKSQTDALHEEIDLAKVRQETQEDLEKYCSQVEAENLAICCKNKTLQDELEEINSKFEPQWTVEYASELHIEMAGLKMETGAWQEKVQQAESTLEEQADMKHEILELEGARNGLREKKEAVQSKHTEVCGKLEPETFKKMCLEKANDIKKENLELKSQTDAFQEEIDLAISRQETQEDLKQYCSQVEAENRVICCKNKTLQDELEKINSNTEPQWTVEYSLKLMTENARLKRETRALQEGVNLAKSRQETPEDLKKHCSQVEAENRVICCKNKTLQDELEEINSNIKPQWSVEYSLELVTENAGLKRETGALQEKVKQAKSKLELQPAMKQQILEMEGVRNGLREKKEAVQNELTQLSDKQEPEICMELCLERINNIEKQISALRSHTDVLQGQLERANAKLQQQMSLKERCLEQEAESRRTQDKNELILREISQTTRKLFKEKSWKHKLETTQVLKCVIDSEQEQLLKHKEKLEKELDVQKTAAFEYKQQLQIVYSQRRDNISLHQDVDKLVTEIRNYKSAQENYKDMAKKDAQVKAKNKQLKKTVVRLQEELKKLGPVEVELENVTHGLDEDREENRYLHDKIRALNEEVTSKKMLQVRLKSLKAEREWFLQRRRGLNEELSWLRGVRLEQLPLREEKGKWDEGNERLLRHNTQLRGEWEEMFVETLSAEVHQDLTSVAKTQSEAMDRLNQELMQEIEEFRTSAE